MSYALLLPGTFPLAYSRDTVCLHVSFPFIVFTALATATLDFGALQSSICINAGRLEPKVNISSLKKDDICDET